MASSPVMICTDLQEQVCNTYQWVDAYLIPPDAETAISLWLTGGFDGDVAGVGFGAVITLWVVGISVGLILSQVRKLRR